jgi:hypothetical protein
MLLCQLLLCIYGFNPPRQAAEGEVEGWVWVRFAVNPDGRVSENAIAVVDSVPHTPPSQSN